MNLGINAIISNNISIYEDHYIEDGIIYQGIEGKIKFIIASPKTSKLIRDELLKIVRKEKLKKISKIFLIK